jgi:diadenosine tetraphosphate (Ap4A) HIT family hydrolase
MPERCPFCELPDFRVLARNKLALAFRDAFPVTAGHSLVVPRRHVVDYFGLSPEEVLACNELVHRLREEIEAGDPSVTGFNIGANAGADAGQSVFHCHIHVIPRRKGDVENPRGGVRHVIPWKGSY